MSLLQSTLNPSAPSSCAFTILSTLTSHGRTIEQAQYVTEHYVVTEVAGSTVVFARGLNGRFIVDRIRKQLKPLNLEGTRPAPEQVRSLLGQLTVEQDDGPFEIAGYTCRALRISNRDARLVVSVDTYCTRIEGLHLTALDAERGYDAPDQPFTIPLEPNEVIVRSTTRALAADFEQSQTLQLRAVTPTVEQRDILDEVLRYPVVEV